MIRDILEQGEYSELKVELLKYETKDNELEREIVDFIEGDYGMLIITILIEISAERKIAFWYNFLSDILSFYLSHIEGALDSALYMSKKSYELDGNDDALFSLFRFYLPPYVNLISKEEALKYAELILLKIPNHREANQIIKMRGK